MAAITRLGAYGGPRSLYGSFAGKIGADAPVVEKIQFGKTFYPEKARLRAEKARLQAELFATIVREDEEILVILNIIRKYLL
jgi:hypothetical protein